MRELARSQGFPDDFGFVVLDSSIAAGSAVVGLDGAHVIIANGDGVDRHLVVRGTRVGVMNGW